MPLAVSRLDRQEQLRVDTAKKFKLERAFIRQLKPYFRRIAKDAATEYRRSGTIITLDSAQAELNVMLRAHYRRVQNKFKKTLQNETFKSHNIQLIHFKQDLNTDVEADLAQYRVDTSNQQAPTITGTTEKDLNESFLATIVAFSENNIRPTNAQVALAASVEFNRHSQGRTETISETETQNSAEDTKSVEAAAIIAAGIVIAGTPVNSGNVIKTWSSLLTDTTRASHAAADDQQQPESQPFIVQGQFLKYPGDRSLGASLNNVINCHCNSSRVINVRGEFPGAIPQSELEGARQPRGEVPTRGRIEIF